MPTANTPRSSTPLRLAVAGVGVEAAGLGVLAAILVYQDVVGDPTHLAAALLLTAFTAGAAVLLGWLARALAAGRGGVRGVTIVAQLMAVPVGYYLATGGPGWPGAVLIGWALAVSGLLVSPSATRALGVDRRGQPTG